MAEATPAFNLPVVTDIAEFCLEVEVDYGADVPAHALIDLTDGDDGIVGDVTVGRVPANVIVLRAGNVARHQVVVTVRGHEVCVADRGSPNGTFLMSPDEPTTRIGYQAIPLAPFASVLVGGYRLRCGLVPRRR